MNTLQSAESYYASKQGNEQFLSKDTIIKLMADFADAKFESLKQNKELWLTGMNYVTKRSKTSGIY